MYEPISKIESLLAPIYKAKGIYAIDCVFDLLYNKINDTNNYQSNFGLKELALTGLDIFSLSIGEDQLFDTEYRYLEILKKTTKLNIETHDIKDFSDIVTDPTREISDHFLWCDAYHLPDLESFHYQQWHERTLISIKNYDSEDNRVDYCRGNHTFTTDLYTFEAILTCAEQELFQLHPQKDCGHDVIENLCKVWATYNNSALVALKAIGELKSYYPYWYSNVTAEKDQSYAKFKVGNTFTFMRDFVLKGLLLQIALKVYINTADLDRRIEQWERMLTRWNEVSVQAQWIVLTKRASTELESKWREAMMVLYQQFELLLQSIESLIHKKKIP